MPNKRDLNLSQYNISKYAYRELENFCLQYPEKKKQLSELHNREYLLKPTSCDDMPHGTGHSDPTASAGEKAARLSADCKLIEQTAIETDSTLYQYILLAVTQGIPYWCLKSLKDIPCYEREFIRVRRYFFYLLAKRKGMV